jgi:hypothetical protein
MKNNNKQDTTGTARRMARARESTSSAMTMMMTYCVVLLVTLPTLTFGFMMVPPMPRVIRTTNIATTTTTAFQSPSLSRSKLIVNNQLTSPVPVSSEITSPTTMRMMIDPSSAINTMMIAETEAWVQPTALFLGPFLNFMSFAMVCSVNVVVVCCSFYCGGLALRLLPIS